MPYSTWQATPARAQRSWDGELDRALLAFFLLDHLDDDIAPMLLPLPIRIGIASGGTSSCLFQTYEDTDAITSDEFRVAGVHDSSQDPIACGIQVKVVDSLRKCRVGDADFNHIVRLGFNLLVSLLRLDNMRQYARYRA